MPKVWKFSPHHSDDLIKQLLFNRGVKTEKEKQKFLHPNLGDYDKDLQIPGIAKAKERILKAIKNKELIVIYGDYDADGVCGSAVLYLGLTSIGAKVLPYIPHREKEGYGLSEEGLKNAQEKGASLVITVDNGIVAIKEAKFAKSLGLDLIITDHHVPLEKNPEALVIIHSVEMSGAAVAWCLIRQLIKGDDALELLDLVAIATICDMIPLLGVNRAMVKLGLEKLNSTKRVGIKALIAEAGLTKGEITAYQVGYILGPRLNAKGRLEHAMDALRILCTKDKEKAGKLARILGETNDQKKKLVMEAVEEARQIIMSHIGGETMKKVLVLHSENWIPGIIGLVAGRICDEYRIPTIVISLADSQSKGSARSRNGLNIIETIRKCSDLLVDAGGHPRAAGFTIETAKIESFKERLELLVEKLEIEEDILSVEAVLKTVEISKKMVADLSSLEPTGVGNPIPLLASLRVRVSGIRTVGAGQHLKCVVDGIDTIAFSFGELVNTLKEGQKIDLAYHLELNKFNGSENLQFKVIDIKV